MRESEFERLIRSLMPSQRAAVLSVLEGKTIWAPQSRPQWLALLSEADELFYGGQAGGGKGQALDAQVVTPYGFRNMGDLEVGHRICSPAGGNCQIIGVYPLGERQLYRFTFQDGATTEVTGDHIWRYSIAGQQWRKSGQSWKLATTLQLMEKIEGGSGILIPLTKPVQFTKSYRHDFRQIAPYTLGALLGDGGLHRYIRLFTTDREIIDRVKSETGETWSQYDDIAYGATGEVKIELVHWLDKLGLMGKRSWEKFIPLPYKLLPTKERWALLQGLMDTDGYCSGDGKAYYSSTSEQLAQDVQWLVWSLGGRATITDKVPTCYHRGRLREGRRAYTVYIRFPDNAKAFYLPRKRQLAGQYNGGGKELKRRIVSIEKSRRAEAQCIKVDRPDGLYLTDDFIVTHNTDLLLGLAIIAHQRSIIFRREFSQMTGAGGLIERSRDLLRDVARYNGQEHVWRDIPGGRILEFGGVQYEDDKRRYQGRPHDLKAFDEVTEFTESQYRFLTGWARSVDVGQRVRVMATGNPPTHAEGRWVIQHWGPWLDDKHPNPAEPGELRWFAVVGGKDTEVDGPGEFLHDGEAIRPKSRTFIPAALSDNVYLAQTDYSAVLHGLPEPLRSQLLYGDFTIGVSDNPWQVIPTEWVRLAFERYEKGSEPEVGLTALGLDVARGGQDQTVICKRYGNWIPPLIAYPGSDTPDGPTVALRVVEALGGDNVPVYVDIIGVGSSAYDSLAGMDNVRAVAVNFADGSKATDKTGRLKMRNKRAEAYWTLREALDPVSGEALAIAPDNEVLADLTTIRYKVTPSGIQIEAKEDVIQRIGRSPDKGDALALAHLQDQTWWIT